MKKLVYLDNAATTPVDKRVLAAMKPYFFQKYGNPSEFHILGAQSRQVVEESRKIIASFLGAKTEEIIFTSCATESINLSHKGLVEELIYGAAKHFVPHIITSAIEHKAVLETCQHLENLGLAQVTYLPVDKYGVISQDALLRAIKKETVLVSLMYVNNEVGTIQDIPSFGKLIGKINEERQEIKLPRIFFHTDATQAAQYLDCQVDKLGVDLLSLTGHKLYAPKGIGVLYVRKGTPIRRQQDGGGQEMKFRSGTENVPYIVGLGKAVELISKAKDQQKLAGFRDKLIDNILKLPHVYLTGHPQKRAPHIASFVIEGAEGESLVLMLSDKKIIASSGSACTSQVLQPSHVLTAMGVAAEISHGSIRFSLGKHTTSDDIDYVIYVLPKIVSRLRKMAPEL